MLVGISEAIRVLLIDNLENLLINSSTFLIFNQNINIDKNFNQWLAGYIDGDGYFSYSKKGYVSLEITTQIRDKRTLYLIKQKLGGSIKIKSGTTHLRYRLHDKNGLIKLIKAVNGELRNPIRILQFKRLCEKYDIDFIFPQPLTYNNGWLSGFIDANGSIYLDLISSQIFITGCNNNKFLLDPLISIYNGNIYFTNSKGISFKWMVNKKDEILNLLNYFSEYPLRSAKLHRIKLIPLYFDLKQKKAHLQVETNLLGKLWKNFLDKWNKFED
jgi:hypothetical protein